MISIIAGGHPEGWSPSEEPAATLSVLATAAAGTPATYLAFSTLEQTIVAPSVMFVFVVVVSTFTYRVLDQRFVASTTPSIDNQRHDSNDDQGAGGR